MPSSRARRERHALAGLLITAILVGGVAVTVLNSRTGRIEQQARTQAKQGRGLVKASCVLVRAIEQSAETQRRTAQTARELLDKTPKSDPERPARIKARKDALKQGRELQALARDMRKGINCPTLSKDEGGDDNTAQRSNDGSGEGAEAPKGDTNSPKKPKPSPSPSPDTTPSPTPSPAPTPAPAPAGASGSSAESAGGSPTSTGSGVTTPSIGVQAPGLTVTVAIPGLCLELFRVVSCGR